jgi:hypothetical protein
MLTATAIGLAAIPTFFIFHVFACRLLPLTKRISGQKLVILVVALTTILAFTFTWLRTGSIIDMAHSFVLCGFYGMIYFHWFNMSETARRIRILTRYVALGESPPPAGGPEEQRRIFANRIVRMKELGTITENAGVLTLNRGPLLYATRIIVFWRSLFFPEKP